MSLFVILKEKRTERKNISDAATAIFEKAHKEKRSATPEEVQEFERRFADVDRLGAECELIEKQYMSEQDLSKLAGDTRQAGREDTEHRGNTTLSKEKRDEWDVLTFRAWCAGGPNRLTGEMRANFIAVQEQLAKDDNPEVRALSDVTGASGAYTIPQGFQNKLEVALKWYGGIVSAADYLPTDSGALLPWPSFNDTGNTGEGPIAENTQVMGTTGGAAGTDPTFGVVNFSAYMMDSGVILVPVQLFQDSAFDIEGYLNDALKVRLGRRKNQTCTTGSGVNQPTGVVVAASAGATGSLPTAITYNDTLNLLHSVDPAYRVGDKVGYMFNDSTLLALRKLVDANSRPLFIAGDATPGINMGQPDRLNGYQFWINQDMAALGSSAKSMLFGDFSKYKIREVRGIQMVRFGERFMDKLQIGFLAWQRWDGNIVDAGTHPIRYFANSAT